MTKLRARGPERHPALRLLANRLVGIPHGCLKTARFYDEGTASSTETTHQHRADLPALGAGM